MLAQADMTAIAQCNVLVGWMSQVMKALRLQFQERVSEPRRQSKVRPGKRKAR